MSKAIKAYHAAIRRIREQTGCSLQEARAQYKHGRVPETVTITPQEADLTPAQVREIGRLNLTRLDREISDLQNQIKQKEEQRRDWENLLRD